MANNQHQQKMLFNNRGEERVVPLANGTRFTQPRENLNEVHLHAETIRLQEEQYNRLYLIYKSLSQDFHAAPADVWQTSPHVTAETKVLWQEAYLIPPTIREGANRQKTPVNIIKWVGDDLKEAQQTVNLQQIPTRNVTEQIKTGINWLEEAVAELKGRYDTQFAPAVRGVGSVMLQDVMRGIDAEAMGRWQRAMEAAVRHWKDVRPDLEWENPGKLLATGTGTQ
jgi:hypothetical protein